jgi:hypothetical protein
MEWTEIIWPIATVVITGVVTAALAFAVRRGWIDREGHEYLAAAAAIGRERLEEALAKARRPDSDGGAAITATERRQIRDEMVKLAIDSAKGPLRAWVMDRGTVYIEGLIARWMREEEAKAPTQAGGV